MASSRPPSSSLQPLQKLSKESTGEEIQRRIWNNRSRNKSLGGVSVGEVSKHQEAYRKQFLQALQFYCETPSLILNSDLPADLVEFVTSQQYPIEALSLIIQLKKGSLSEFPSEQEDLGSNEGGNKKSQQTQVEGAGSRPHRVVELVRKLVESWMRSDSCTEALVSLSLGDEIPGVLAQTTTFQNLLFAIPECFRIPSEDFQEFLATRYVLAVKTIVYGIRVAEYEGEVRTPFMSSLLDRMFMRYYADTEQFFIETRKQHQKRIVQLDSPIFVRFMEELNSICKNDFIARRLLSKILLSLSSHVAYKVAKTVFLVGYGDNCAAASLFFPPQDFLNCSSWKHVLTSSVPLRTPTKSKIFWMNWAHFIYTSSTSITETWEISVTNWESLCRSSAVSVNILIPSTYALIALAREIKVHHGEKSANILFSVVRVFDNVAKCLDSTSEEKKACGMALAQVMGDLHTFKKSTKEESKKLRFSSSSPIFHELISYYESNTNEEDLVTATDNISISSTDQTRIGKGVPQKDKFEVLDSDDEMEDDVEEGGKIKSEFMVHEDDEEECEDDDDIPVDERILNIRSKKGKLPMYFSEIVEVLVEGGGNAQEDEKEVLTHLSILKTPVLLNLGVKIDERMAQTIMKCLLDFETKREMEIPILFALLEITKLYPFVALEVVATTAFDSVHYTSGHRVATSRRLSDLIRLLSKSKCFYCYNEQLGKHRKGLMSICPEFFRKYFDIKKSTRLCSSCSKNAPEAQSSTGVNSDILQDIERELTWQEIVQQRIQAKTRYFFTRTRQTPVAVQDDYSVKYLPIIWASVANRIMAQAEFYLNEKERSMRGVTHDLFLAQMFRVLGNAVLAVGGSSCPHFGNIATQSGHLLSTFGSHPDLTVRQGLFSLLGTLLITTNAASHIIEALSSTASVFDTIKRLRENECGVDNQLLLDHIMAYLTQAAAEDCTQQVRTGLENDSVYRKFRVLPDIL